jgi:hypothetical protein
VSTIFNSLDSKLFVYRCSSDKKLLSLSCDQWYFGIFYVSSDVKQNLSYLQHIVKLEIANIAVKQSNAQRSYIPSKSA